MRLAARSQATSGYGKPENKRKIYCTNVHLRIIEILITVMYKLCAVTLMLLHLLLKTYVGMSGCVKCSEENSKSGQKPTILCQNVRN